MNRLTGAVLASLLLAGPAAAVEPLPNSMAAVGDSITAAATTCSGQLDCPYESWSTGEDPAVNSHYRRILALNPAISGRNYNNAVGGAWSGTILPQAQQTVAQGVEYVTLFIGANDACASSEADMTPVSTYRANVKQVLDTLAAGLPDARILVVSVPDLYRLWQIAHTDPFAVWYWNQAGICQSMLKNPTSTKSTDERRRQRVRQRVVDFNAQLAQECVLHAHCRFDGDAVFNHPFTLGDLSWDYFHPGVSGQANIAQASNAAGFGW